MIFRTMSFFTLFAVPLAFMASGGPNPTPSFPSMPMGGTSATITEQQAAAARLTYGLLSDKRVAYTQRDLTNEQADEVFTLFIKSLDPQKIFLTQEDIQALRPTPTVLRLAIEGKDLAPVMAIYKARSEGALQRIRQAQQLIDQGFSFNTPDSAAVPTDKTTWPKDQAAAAELLRTTVKGDWLQLKLAGQNDDTIRKTLKRRYERMETSLTRLSSQDAVAGFQHLLQTSRFKSRQIAFVVAKTLARMQIKRAAEGREPGFFSDMDEARAWLLGREPINDCGGAAMNLSFNRP